MKSVISYWCVPGSPAFVKYEAVIERLCHSQGAPKFQPHITLGSATAEASNLDDIVAALKGVELDPLEIDQRDVFTMSLFVRLGLTDQLKKARQALEADPCFRPSRDFDPHISLCYGTPPEGAAEREDVRALLEMPIRIEKLLAVEITLPVEQHSDILSWKPVRTYPL